MIRALVLLFCILSGAASGQVQLDAVQTCASLHLPPGCYTPDLASRGLAPKIATAVPGFSAKYHGAKFVDTTRAITDTPVPVRNGAADWVVKTRNGGDSGNIGTQNGSGAPRTSAAYIGQFYIDTPAGFAWIAKTSGNGAADWIPVNPYGRVSILSFGADKTFTKDSTAAIQAAIDFAYNNHLQGVFCPDGQYKISGAGNAKIYLDPPNNLRSNWSNPPLFQFSLAFVAESGAFGISEQTRAEGCQLIATDSNNIALIVGPGQHMKVSGITVIGGSNCYRANCPAGGVGIGIAGGNGGAHQAVIENTWVDNEYVAYATDANDACCLADSNNFLHVNSGANTYIGILLQGTQTFINRIEEPTLSSAVGIKDTFSKSALVTGGNISAATSQSRSFSISSTGNFTLSGTNPTFTTVLSPCGDIYVPNVYNAWTIVTSNWGVIPLKFVSWNAGTCTITLNVDPDWQSSIVGGVGVTAAVEGEISAASKIYAAERVYVFWGDGITAENTHIENPFACTALFFANQVWNGLNSNKIVSPFFNYDPSLAAFGPSQSPADWQLALYYCQKSFPFIEQTAHDGSRLEIDGGTYGSTTINPPSPLLIRAGAYGRFLKARALNQIQPLNLQINADGNWGEEVTDPADVNTNILETAANGLGEWDENYFLPANLLRVLHPSSVIMNLFHQGGFAVPYYGWRPAPGVQPEMRPDIYAMVSGTLGALGTYPPIDCQTLYRVGVAWNTGVVATGKMFGRSAHCPGYSYGQNLDDSTVGRTNSTFTATISNGSGGAGTQLNITAISSGAPTLNAEVTGTGVSVGTYITACPGGTCGGTGVYTVNNTLNISSEPMKSFPTTVTWHFTDQSVMLYLDSKTVQWMFPGLVFTIVGRPATPYVVTGVYADLGYVTAMDASGNGGNYLHGTGYPTVDTCSIRCALGQAGYSWTQY